MKKLFALVFALALSACAAEVWFDPDGNLVGNRPAHLPGWHSPPDDGFEARGFVKAVAPDCDRKYWLVSGTTIAEMTEAEKAAVDAAEAQSAIDAEALAQLPAVFPTGIAVLDAEGHHIELIPDMESAVVVPVQVSNSPLTPAQRAEMKAQAQAQREAKKTAKAALKASISGAKNDKDKLAAIIAWIEAQ